MPIPNQIKPFIAGREESVRIFKSGAGTQAVVASELRKAGRPVVVVLPGVKEFRELEALLQLFSGAEAPELETPSWENPWLTLPPHLSRRPCAEDWGQRWAALYGLHYAANPKGILLTADNLLPLWPSRETVERNSLPLTRGEDMSIELMLDQIVLWGYRRTQLVSGPGEFSVRGDILDIHAPGYGMPLRLEFFGDTLEEIRLFDPSSQRSRADMPEAVILPVGPAVLDDDSLAAARKHWKKLRTTGVITSQAEQHLRERIAATDAFIWPGLYSPQAAPLEEHFPSDSVFVLSSASQLRARLEEREWGWKDYLQREHEDGSHKWPFQELCRPAESARKVWQGRPTAVFEDLTIGVEKDGIDLAETPYSGFGDIFWQPESRRRPWTALMEGLAKWRKAGETTLLSFRTERSRSKFLNLAEQSDIPMSVRYTGENAGIYALVSPFSKGLQLDWAGLRVLGEDVLQPDGGAKHVKRAQGAFQGMDSYDDLVPDDLLVHRDYGLARFGGLHHMQIGDVHNDYLLLYFSGDDKLYVPVDRLNLVQRFKGPEGSDPSLDKLGGARWAKTTARARKAIEKIARELVEMYAFRRVAKGYRYGPEDEMYREFEATFGFEETPDQARAVSDVFRDMQSTEPMDRLICGDVGFGKTEVALRAAFRAVADGRQVALLCPTTVLAEQHYQTFMKRMEGFPVRVGMLSRFVPPKRQKQVVQAAARGEIDILIGTHRLLSKDVELPKVGLLILDEEQRFGVKHKEKLKHYRKSVDVLTLTATPIPRTLQLSLSGLRGLSVIETPPVDRKPVETALVERDEEMLRAVLERELARGGQVFWVYNRVQGLERAAEFVRELVPHARVGMAHGQMNERPLEEAIHKFWHHELDVLVCTAIVESGLDFPNANTLIVDQAQMFGLGQLYQLRGRVGRSERQAYAYFIVPSVDDLSDIARRRLRIILDMDYLGAGFKVAMEDLRLRGAGNILGEVQSGQIAKVGLDLFLEMLEEEVGKLRGESLAQVTDPEMNFVFEAHIPGEYVPDAKERLRYYKALSAAGTESSLRELEGELRDRFGPPPVAVEQFLAVLDIKRCLGRLQVVRADLFPNRVVLAWGEDTSVVTPQQLVEWVAVRNERAKLLPPGKLELRLDESLSLAERLLRAARELEELTPAPE